MYRVLLMFSLTCFLSACGGTTVGKKPDPPKKPQKGLLRVASFEIRLEDTDPDSSAPFRPILSNNGLIRLNKEVLFTNLDLVDAYVKDNPWGLKTLWIIFSKDAAVRLRKVSGENKGRKLAIIVDGQIWIAPTIQEEIPDGQAQITGRSVQSYLNRLMERLTRTGK